MVNNTIIVAEFHLTSNLSECNNTVGFKAKYYNEEDNVYGDEIPVKSEANKTKTVITIKIPLESLEL